MWGWKKKGNISGQDPNVDERPADIKTGKNDFDVKTRKETFGVRQMEYEDEAVRVDKIDGSSL